MPLAIVPAFVLLSYWTLTTLQLRDVANDPGLGWHLLTGELVIRSGAVPRFDPFLAWLEPRRWISDQWLSDFIFAAALRFDDGERGMALLFGGLTGLFLFTFFGLVFGTAVRKSGSPVLGGIAAFIGLKVASVQFILRPVVFGIFLFALVAGFVWRIIDRVQRRETLRVKDVCPLIPITVLWANLHPSFGLGVLLVGLTFFGLVIDSAVIDQKSPPTKSLFLLGMILPLMLASSLVNPNGIELLKQVISLVGSEYFMNLNEEWRPINVRSFEGKQFLLIIGVMLLGSYLSRQKREYGHITEPLVITCFTWLALSSVRFLPYFAIVSVPVFARALRQLVAWEPFIRIPVYRRVGAFLAVFDNQALRGLRKSGYVTVIVALFPLCSAMFFGTVYPFRGAFEQSGDQFPFEAVDALHTIITEDSLSEPIAVCATPDWGGFLAFHGKGRFKPIIDDRNSLLGEEFYRDYFSSVSIRGDVRSFLKRSSSRFLLLGLSEPLAIYLRDTGKLRVRWRGSRTILFEAES